MQQSCPRTRDELKDLACLGFSADMTMQSFCHTAAYPKLVDVKMHRELPSFISTRSAVTHRSHASPARHWRGHEKLRGCGAVQTVW